MVRYKIFENVDTPTPQRSRRLTWDVPLEDIAPGSKMTLYMTPKEARERVHAFRSFVDRQQHRLGRKFSVYLTDDGIEVFPRVMKKMIRPRPPYVEGANDGDR